MNATASHRDRNNAQTTLVLGIVLAIHLFADLMIVCLGGDILVDTLDMMGLFLPAMLVCQASLVGIALAIAPMKSTTRILCAGLIACPLVFARCSR